MFVIAEYHNSPLQLFEREKKIIQTLSPEEMF